MLSTVTETRGPGRTDTYSGSLSSAGEVGKDPDVGKDRKQKEKRAAGGEMVR